MTTNPQKDYDRLYKFVLVGDSGAGKSSFLLRLIKDEFTDSYISTIGVDFMINTYTIGNIPKKVKIQVWDTAGRERFRTITSSYWRGANGIVFIYDVTNRQSFENMLQYRKEMEKYASENVQCILVATKADLESKRVVTEDEGQKLADSWNAPFAEVSSKTGANVEESFLSFLTAMHEHLDPILPDPNQKTPSTPTATKSKSSSWWSSPFKWVLGLS